MNFWFYLLSEGGAATNGLGNAYSVTGIGIDKAANIAYRAETVHMSASTDFANARNATIDAARNLYGNNSPEIVAVTNAWHAVGVGDRHPPIISGSSTFCSGTNYNFSVSGALAGFTWSNTSNLNLSGTGTSVTVSAVSGAYGDGWVSINNGGVELVRYLVWVGPPIMNTISGSYYPTVNNAENYYPIVANYTEAGVTGYQWSLSPMNSSIMYDYGSSVTIYFNPSGSYTLSARACNTCGYGSWVNFYINVGRNIQSPAYVVYPNPVTDFLNIEIPQTLSKTNTPLKYDIRLYDSQGSLALQTTTTQTGTIRIDVSNLLKGTYMLQIYDGVDPQPYSQILIKH